MLLECLIILDKYQLVCQLSPLGKLTCSWKETYHQTQNTFKAYAVTLTSGDIGKLISMMPPLKKKKHKTMLGSRQHGVLSKPPQGCKMSKENPSLLSSSSGCHSPGAWLLLHRIPWKTSAAEFSQSGIRLLTFKT